MIKATLQTRLVILMIFSSIFLISAFAAIQLNNQIERASEFNIYKAKSGALIAKSALQNLYRVSDPTRSPASQVAAVLSALIESDVLETAVLLGKDGNSLLAEGKPRPVSDSDKTVARKILQVTDKSKWLFPFVDKKERLANLFMLVDNPYGHVFKLTFSLGNLQQAMNDVYGPVIITVIIVIVGNIIFATLLSRMVISPVKVLNDATKAIAEGNLDRKVSIRTQDELEELADTFNYMTGELKKMKAIAENANPLTKLPGNIVIRDEVDRRLKKDEKFVLIYCDLDNFKAFNDKYGVHAGDQAIVMTSKIFKEAIAEKGGSGDFVGHEGGDDFLLLTVPQRAEDIANYIMEEFDKRIRSLYTKEDLDRGYIEAKSRESDKIVQFPVMTISLAGVSNVERKIESYAQLTNIAAGTKKAVKAVKASKFIIDRRKEDLGKKHRDGDS